MEFNLKNIDVFAERYLDDSLSASEWNAIRKILDEDSVICAAWDNSLKFIRTLRSAGEHYRTRRMIEDVVAKSKIGQEKYNNTNKSFIIPQSARALSFRKLLKMSSVAAMIAIVASVITFWIATSASKKSSSTQYTQLRREIGREIANIKQNQLPAGNKHKSTEEAATTPMPGDYGGSGFAITNDGYIATNYHVVDGADSIFVQTPDGNYYKSFVVAFDPKSDIAILKINNNKFRFSRSATLPYAISKKRADLAQQVFSIGYPSDDPVYNEGYISSQNGYEGDNHAYQLEITANPGQSGAPVFDQSGNVIAIVTAKQKNATYAIHCDALVKLVQSLPEANKITVPAHNALSRLSRTEQVKRAMDYVCAVRVYK